MFSENLELTIKINQVPANVIANINGWKQFEIDTGGQIITLALKPEVYQQIEQAPKKYSQWVAVIVGQVSQTNRGFFLKNTRVTVNQLQTFLQSKLPDTQSQIAEAEIRENRIPVSRVKKIKEKEQSNNADTNNLSDKLTSSAISSLPKNETSYEILLKSKTPDNNGLVFMKKLNKGLQEFKANYFSNNQDLFEQLSEGQTPSALFITCSDSRIDPNLITQTKMGELFVLRNAGNIIPPFGAANGGEGAVLEYAIHALGIEQIIVCGHTQCGAMKGMLKLGNVKEEMPIVYDWLQHTEATMRLVKDNYKSYDSKELLKIAIAENVLTQIANLKTYPVVRSKLNQGKLHIYGWIYQIEIGEVLVYDPISHGFKPFPHYIPD